jgi:type II secretory pathway component PulF
LKSISDAVISYWPMMLVGLGVIIGGISLLLRTTAGRRAWHGLLLRLPLLGPLFRRLLVAQFAQQLALLLKTGVTFLEAARCIHALTRHQLLKDELAILASAVESGRDIAPALRESKVFPPVVVHLFGVGQETGELPEMLSQLKTRYEAEVKLAVSKFTAALEPALIVGLAGGVGFVVYACLMPILEATRGIS